MKINQILQESECAHGRYYCSTDKKWKCRQGPKQTRASESVEQGVAEGKEDKIAQLKKDYATAVHWSKNETSPQKREAARQKAEKIKRHLETQYKQSVSEGSDHDDDYSTASFEKWKKQKEYEKEYDKKKPAKPIVPDNKDKKKGVAEEKQRLDPKCWDGYKKQGTKMKGGVRVNNCVPESVDPEDVGEYDQEGKMAIQDLSAAADAANELRSILDSNENLPEWVQSKITKALDYLDTARDYMKFKDSGEETYEGNEFYEAYGDLWYDEETLTEAEYQGRKVPLGKPMRGDVKKFKVYVKDPKTGNVKKVNFGDPDMKIKKSNPARRKSFRARHHCENPGPRTKARYWSCRAW